MMRVLFVLILLFSSQAVAKAESVAKHNYCKNIEIWHDCMERFYTSEEKRKLTDAVLKGHISLEYSRKRRTELLNTFSNEKCPRVEYGVTNKFAIDLKEKDRLKFEDISSNCKRRAKIARPITGSVLSVISFSVISNIVYSNACLESEFKKIYNCK